MIKIRTFLGFLIAFIFLVGMQLPVNSQQDQNQEQGQNQDQIQDCIADEDSGVCQEGECRLTSGVIGICKPSGNSCTCVPIN